MEADEDDELQDIPLHVTEDRNEQDPGFSNYEDDALVEGTTDEIDYNAGEAVHPAPPPSREMLESTAVDISANSRTLNPDMLPATYFQEGTDAHPTHDTEFGKSLHTSADKALAGSQVERGNAGGESPARKILELPPALDLRDTFAEEEYQTIRNLTLNKGSFTTDKKSGRGMNALASLPLASPTTDAALLQAAQQQQQKQVSVLDLGSNGTSASSGLGISTEQATEMASGSGSAQRDQEQPGEQSHSLPVPTPKQPVFAYHHDDTDTTMAELEEFFSYVEVRGVVEEGRESWARGWEALCEINWTQATDLSKNSHIYHLIEELEHRDPEIRFEAARRIAYIAHGTPIYSSSPQRHLHLIISNCSLLRSVGALAAVHEALKSASNRWNIMSSIPEGDGQYQQASTYYPSLTLQERQEYLEEINGELAIHLSILYFMVEIFRGDETWADELMALDPPLPIYLLNLVAGLREKNAKGYPVKKLLLLLWKALLACLGGNKDINRVKRLVRTVECLPHDSEEASYTQLKVNPLDFAQFKCEILNKYPTYDAPDIIAPIPQISMERIVAAAASAPLRSLYSLQSPAGITTQPVPQVNSGPGALPATPAPTPPPSPPPLKPKKQQYQTDQSKPFLLPFSSVNIGGGHYSSIKGKERMTVPFSIFEAGKLYKRNTRINTELWQLWKLREEYLADETGVGIDPPPPAKVWQSDVPATLAGLTKQLDGVSLEDGLTDLVQQRQSNIKAEARPDALSMLYQLESQLRKDFRGLIPREGAIKENQGKTKEQRTLLQKIADVQRLQRVELIYRSTLSNLQSTVIVLLKLLLATVTANTNTNVNAPEGEVLPSLSLEDTDILRHREITSKAVSAILVLTLRWFKASHAMKFHYLAHLLVDSNCLLLILKMFGLQEVSNQVRMKNEVDEWNFFQFCHLYASQNPALVRPEDGMLRSQEAGLSTNGSYMQDLSLAANEPEVITNFSRRNFFAVINFVHVLQKLTKRKAHRILLLVQYKSSAILKRILKVSHPLLQLYVLKVIKSQVPFCGRKWRQSNMKVITAIYLNCRPDLRDEWLTTVDVENDLDESLPHEQTLRTLVRFYNTKHYGAFAPHLHRPSSAHMVANGFPTGESGTNLPHASHPSSGTGGTHISHGLVHPSLPPLSSPSTGFHPPLSSPSSFDNEAFPPTRPLSNLSGDEHYRSSYIPDSLMDGYLEDYEELLGEFFTPVYDSQGMPISGAIGTGATTSPGGTVHIPGLPPASRGLEEIVNSNYMSSVEQAWHQLGKILGKTDSISDTESVSNIGFIDLASDGEGGEIGGDDLSQQGRNDWEHLSPDFANALEDDLQRQEKEDQAQRTSPGRRKRSASPRIRRSSSGTPRSPALRPIFMDAEQQGYEDDSALDEDEDLGEGPFVRSVRRSPYLSPSKVAIDEVEAFFD